MTSTTPTMPPSQQFEHPLSTSRQSSHNKLRICATTECSERLYSQKNPSMRFEDRKRISSFRWVIGSTGRRAGHIFSSTFFRDTPVDYTCGPVPWPSDSEVWAETKKMTGTARSASGLSNLSMRHLRQSSLLGGATFTQLQVITLSRHGSAFNYLA